MPLNTINNLKLRLRLALTLSLLVVASVMGVQRIYAISQGFGADDPSIVNGTLVSLKDKTANTVELATTNNLDRLLGVVVQNSLIEQSDGSATVQVATNGEAIALVSDINGDIKTGDHVTVSPIEGVGMRADEGTVVIGTAQADLSSVETDSRTISDKDGNDKTVKIGAISVQVEKVLYGLSGGQSNYVPPFLQDFANDLAGRPVSPIRVMVSTFLIVLTFVIVGILLYSSIRSSIISIGRNPLSEGAVHRSLIQIGLAVVCILAFAVIVIYFILTA